MRTTGKSRNKTWIFGGMLALVLTFMMVLFCDGTGIISRAAGQAKVIKESVNIRKEASASSDKVGSAVNGDVFTVNSEVQGGDGYVWYQVSGNGVNGYIRANLMEKVGNDTTAPAVTPSINPSVEVTNVEPVKGKVAGNSQVRVRADVTTANDSNIITRVGGGTEVTVKGKAVAPDGKDWYLIIFYGSDGKTIEGFIRHDYVELSGALVPATPVDPPVEGDEPSDPVVDDPVVEEPKEYDTQEGDDGVWYLLDYTKGEKWDIVKLFDEQKTNVADLIDAKSAVKAQKIVIVILVILLIAAVAFAALLYFKIRDISDDAYFAAVEKETIRERNAMKEKDPRAPAPGRKVMQTVGTGAPRTNAQPGQARPGQPTGTKPAAQNPAGTRPATQNPAVRGTAGAARPANAQGRPVQNAGQPRPQMANPAGQAQPRPAQPGQVRPGQPAGQQRPAAPAQPKAPAPAKTPAQPTASAQPAKKRNFIDDDEFEFEFLNWDGDEK